MAKKPKKIRETAEEVAQKNFSRTNALRGERILSRVTPAMVKASQGSVRDVALGRANADINQATRDQGAKFDPSGGRGMSRRSGLTLGRRTALSEQLNRSFNKALNLEDTMRSNVIASGTGTAASIGNSLSTLSDISANNQAERLKRQQSATDARLGALTTLGAGAAFKYGSKSAPSLTDEDKLGYIQSAHRLGQAI